MLKDVLNVCHFIMIVGNLGNQDCLGGIAQGYRGAVAMIFLFVFLVCPSIFSYPSEMP